MTTPRAIPLPRPRPRAGFTLLELVVVIIMMTVVLGLAAPRLMQTGRRAQEVTVERVADLLSIAAHRDALGGRHVGIRFDDETSTLTLMVRELGEGEWRADPVTRAVELDDLEFTEVQVGSSTIRGGRDPWWIDFPQGQQRLPVTLTIAPTRRERTSSIAWVVRLPAYATAAAIQRPGEPAAAGADAIDLDAAGLEDVAW